MRRDILTASRLLSGKTTLSSKDFREVLPLVSEADLVYMDPPYQGVCMGIDPRYLCGVSFRELVGVVKELSKRGIAFLLSYDGRSGNKVYGQRLPDESGLCRIELKTGRSAQATLLGRSEITYEALYLSPPLLERLRLQPHQVEEIARELTEKEHPTLIGGDEVATFR